MDRDTELALVARLKNGDTDAFDAVHAALHVRVFTFLLRLTRRRDLSEDLAEETWLRLVAHARRLRADTQLAPWLFTVARNLYVSHCRARTVEEAYGGLLALWPGHPAQPSPFDETAASELERRIERALARMPATSREVLLLVGIDGLQPAEAAVVCGVSAETLRQRLSRARVQLAAALEECEAPGRVALGEAMP